MTKKWAFKFYFYLIVIGNIFQMRGPTSSNYHFSLSYDRKRVTNRHQFAHFLYIIYREIAPLNSQKGEQNRQKTFKMSKNL